MEQDKNLLQSIKLEISRNFKLVPYERLAFHKILGMLKTDIGVSILIKELEKGPDIRESALAILTDIPKPQILTAIKPLLAKSLTDNEKIFILDHIQKYGSADDVPEVMSFIQEQNAETVSRLILTKAFRVIQTIGAQSDEVMHFLINMIDTPEPHIHFQCEAILSLSSFRIISVLEEILKMNNDTLSYYVYRTIADMNNQLNIAAGRAMGSDETDLYTYSTSQTDEDKIILDIRVLLGKMSPRFENYSTGTKVAFITAMVSCNHREYLIYVMKALTSKNTELISMTLYALNTNIEKLKDPDKLFRNLIALSTESQRDNELIVEMFIKFFTGIGEERKYHILKDKLFSYIVVTLESYFETYRKEYMIRSVAEKSYPESFQMLRKFILENMTPELKKRTIYFLSSDESRNTHLIIKDYAGWIPFISEHEKEQLHHLIEILFDDDKKSRENSASRIEDIEFEKRYLRNRILRLCNIIALLHIEEAASPLVNIYNYLKKYPDQDLIHTIIQTLAILNYSYMLGEIEILLTTGVPEEQIKALGLISFYTEQRSLNILFEFLQTRVTEESGIIETALEIMLERDIVNNMTANQIFKKIIENNTMQSIRNQAILGLGKCGFDGDIDYLNELFFTMNNSEGKDMIVRAMGEIIFTSEKYNKRQVTRYFHEYLKDPGIRVRIYSCLCLIKMGDNEALRSIRDMLIIKNKIIQRDILTILGELRSIEFSFFLVSLLKEEYGMSDDITAVLKLLPEEDLKEIDGFIVNIFRKFEAPDFGDLNLTETKQTIRVDNLKHDTVTIVNINVIGEDQKLKGSSVAQMIRMNLRVKSFISSAITEHRGIISRITNEQITSYFNDPADAVNASLRIVENIKSYSSGKIFKNRIHVLNQIITVPVDRIGDELVHYPSYIIDPVLDKTLYDIVIIDESTWSMVKERFAGKIISELLFSSTVSAVKHYEISSPVNFKDYAESVLDSLFRDRETKKHLEEELETELKNIRRGGRSTSSAAVTRDLENLGNLLLDHLNEIEKYVQRRSTDRELNRNLRKMLVNVYNMYKVEISRLIIE